jgi:chloramphenicol-sensitive protein RarD
MKLSTLGFFQYLAPTLQFLLAMFYFHEAFDVHKAIGYALVWLGLAIVIIETALHMGRSRKV